MHAQHYLQQASMLHVTDYGGLLAGMLRVEWQVRAWRHARQALLWQQDLFRLCLLEYL